MNESAPHISRLLHLVDGDAIEESLKAVASEFPGRATFSSSFGIEDQVITHVILTNGIPISIFTLDTGRLFPETYSLWSLTNERYRTRIRGYFPDHASLESFLSESGPDAFYESVEKRTTCCRIRKVEPLSRALHGNALWVTGMRAEQSPERRGMPLIEWDESNAIIKYHPLLHWSAAEVEEFIRRNNVPYNPLHDRGFASIGCAPCTRAIGPGEDFRAGRWWWEDESKKECGLHVRGHTLHEPIEHT